MTAAAPPAHPPPAAAPDRAGLAMLATGHFTIDMCVGALPAFLPAFTALYALSDLAAAMILGASLLASSAIQPLFGLLADRRPAPVFLWGGVAVAAAGLAAAGLAGGYTGVLACIVGSGLGIAAFHPEAARVANRLSGERTATGLAWFMVGGNAGFAAGPLVAAIAIPFLDERATLVFLVPGLVVAGLLFVRRDRLAAAMTPPAAAELRAARTPAARARREPAAGRDHAAHLAAVRPAGAGPAVPGRLARVLGRHGRHRRVRVRRRGRARHGGRGGAGGPGGRAAHADLDPAAGGAPPWPASCCSTGRAAIAMLVLAGFIAMASFSVTVAMAQEYMPGRLALAAGLMIGFGAIGSAPPGLALFGAIADAAGRETAIWGLAALPLVAGALATMLPAPRPPGRARAAVA